MPTGTNGSAKTSTTSLPAATPSQTSDAAGEPKPEGTRPRRRRRAKDKETTPAAEAGTAEAAAPSTAQAEAAPAADAPADDAPPEAAAAPPAAAPTPAKKRRGRKAKETAPTLSPLELIGSLALEAAAKGTDLDTLVSFYEAACVEYRKAMGGT